MTREPLETHRAPLLAHCYRMLGSVHDAEDVMQDVMVRALRGRDAFETRSSLRTWLYAIATNLCIDTLRRARRRELPISSGARIAGDDATPTAREPALWIEPFPDAMLPDAKYIGRESVRLAFIAALQRLTPEQRAVLLLRDVIGFGARDVAGALKTSVAAVNSALHRARAVVKTRGHEAPRALTAAERALLDQYVRAWTSGDVNALAAVLSEGVTFSMPPNPAWLRGKRDVARYLERVVMGRGGARRLVATRANGAPAFGVYMRAAKSKGAFTPHTLHVVSLARGRVRDIISFRDATLFRRFALPAKLPS